MKKFNIKNFPRITDEDIEKIKEIHKFIDAFYVELDKKYGAFIKELAKKYCRHCPLDSTKEHGHLCMEYEVACPIKELGDLLWDMNLEAEI